MFLEEAKSMLEIGEYHENIVNLQGVIYGHEDIQKGLPKVRFKKFVISYSIRKNKIYLFQIAT